MKNTKHILVTVLIVSMAVLSVVAIGIFQPVTTNTLPETNCSWKQQEVSDVEPKNARKGVLVECKYSNS